MPRFSPFLKAKLQIYPRQILVIAFDAYQQHRYRTERRAKLRKREVQNRRRKAYNRRKRR